MQKMIAVGDEYYWSQPVLAEQLRVLGLQPGDAVMVHASLRAAGPCLNGADDLIDALLQCTGENGTLLCYVNWLENYEDSTGDDGCVPAVLKPLITPFDVRTSRANPDHGVFAECFRTRPGALRSADGSTDWVMSEEFDTADPVCDCFPEGYFAQIVADFCQQNNNVRQGNVGSAAALLVSAREMRDFAVSWMMAYQHNAG